MIIFHENLEAHDWISKFTRLPSLDHQFKDLLAWEERVGAKGWKGNPEFSFSGFSELIFPSSD